VNMVFYYKVTDETLDSLRDEETASGPQKLFARFCREAIDEDPPLSPSEDEWKGRFKVILNNTNMGIFGLPGFITAYNAKPVLIRSTGQVFKGEHYIEQVINTHAFGAVCRKALSVLLDKIPDMYFDVGFVIESRDDEEMPETLLGYGSMNKPVAAAAPDWEAY